MSNSKRIVISQSVKRKSVPKGSSQLFYTEQVVYHTENGLRTNGKKAYTSQTKHEIIQGKR